MAKAPEYVRQFLRDVPASWDDVKFIDGYPGQFVVIARRAGQKWWIAGINADREPRKVRLDFAGSLITDGGDALGFNRVDFRAGEIEMRGRGGFVLTSSGR